jgi:hypothetical protein
MNGPTPPPPAPEIVPPGRPFIDPPGPSEPAIIPPHQPLIDPPNPADPPLTPPPGQPLITRSF